MHKKDQYPSKNDRSSEEALRDEANKPEPLYNKTDRNFERQYQGPQQGTAKDQVTGEIQPEGSSSDEEKDII